MKRSPLQRKTPLLFGEARSLRQLAKSASKFAKSLPRSRPKKRSKYATRERAPESWWRFVKSQPCFVAQFVALQMYGIASTEIAALPLIETPCGGVIEADHEGKHGLSRKGPDNEVAPICTQHHRERTDHTGAFKQFKKADMRSFVQLAVIRTHRLAQLLDVRIPTC